MTHSRKCRQRQPSIISSETDRRFSPSRDSESSESSGDSDSAEPVEVPQKRPKPPAKRVPAPQGNPNPAGVMLDYIIAIFSPAEMKKAINKRLPKNMSLRLSTDEPWDTVKAQILVKIDAALNPQSINYEHYNVSYSIPRVIAKPGYPLSADTDYTILVDRARKPKLVHLNVTPIASADDKENNPADQDAEKQKKKRSRRDPAELPGYVNKVAQMRALQDHWKCPKQTVKCFGVHCFIDKEGVHLPLSHEMFDCWAACIVSIFHSLSLAY
jgi:hypothetical protein